MSIYNDDELAAPSWINQEFLEKVLTKYEQKENVEIIKFDMSPASVRGDHYASIMFRCKAEYRFDGVANKNKSFIIKTLPVEDGVKREMLMQSRLFETEIDMYCQTLPKMEKILAECGEPTKLSAEIIYHALEPQKIIIMEDLCESGYDTLRGRYLTEDEMKAIYRKLAKLHAVSYMLGQSDVEHEEVSKYQEGLFMISAIMDMGMMSTGIDYFIKMLSKQEEFKIYAEKIEAMKPVMHEQCRALYNAYNLNNGKGDIFVLNHGDFHMKNLMFKFSSENHLEDLMMVDYQICIYAPSTIDLFYTQLMMLSPDLRLKRNDFMQYYFMEFVKILKKINYQGEMPKFSDLQIAGIKYRHFTLFLVATFLPLVRGIIVASLDDLKGVDIEAMVETPDTTELAYQHPDFIEDMRNFLPILLSEGYLD